MAGQNYCVVGGCLLSLNLCRSGFQDLLKVRPSSLFILCGCISSSIASLMSRSMYPVLAERSLVSCSLIMWSWLKLCSATADLSGCASLICLLCPTVLKFSHYLPTCLWRWNIQSVPKRRHIKFRRRGITQKKTYNTQNVAEVWNQECPVLFFFLSRNNLERQPHAMKTCWGMDFHLHAFLTSKLQGDMLSDLSSGRNTPLHHKAEGSCSALCALYCLENRKPPCLCRITDSNSSFVCTNRRLDPPLTEIFWYCPVVYHPYRRVLEKFA